ncbi:glyoxalase/bleomycin resistance/dioxygenase family protein [Bacillus cereus]|uniref:VOC family protein n=1 Tax=Bacillus paramycoides TaxID=2026194 RepID=UPI000BF3BDAF|nr:glyoxalase/bleomycin resistance/dioxygenase family protein [Bacillus paramycoides]PFD32496.1 glyoxalase/bleomycin resistance/dioxygenase family protein [Bacillus cereus]
MITHISDLELQTLSLEGVKQVYQDILCFPIKNETESFVQFQITPYTTISFREVLEPITPAHFAFQVPMSIFQNIVTWLLQSGIQILKNKNGDFIIHNTKQSRSLYFKDGDGNILEIISHDYLKEGILNPVGKLQVIYLREIGLPVESVPVFRDWLKQTLQMKMLEDQDIFNLVIGGTAHAVVVSKGRPWIPIGMRALPPKMHISFGTTSLSFLKEIQDNLFQSNVKFHSNTNEISFIREGYSFSVHLTENFKADIPKKLKLPLSI